MNAKLNRKKNREAMAKSITTKIIKRQEAIALLQSHRADLEALGVGSLWLFGSVARNQATEQSDVDVLVEFSRPVGLLIFSRLQRHLELWFGCSVDLGTPDSLKPYLRNQVMEDAIRVF